MKISKLILSITLVALATTVFGRITEPEADSYCCPADIFMEQDLSVENWMIEPFEPSVEIDLAMESWMSEPFDTYFENELSLETWMTTPFETVGETVIEDWMATAWF